MSAVGISVLLAVDAGLLRNALQNMLSTMPQVSVLTITSDILTTKQAITSYQPSVVLLDIDLLAEQISGVEEICRIIAPYGYCLVLANNKDQKLMVEKLGAQNAILKGTHAKKLEQIIVGAAPAESPALSDSLAVDAKE